MAKPTIIAIDGTSASGKGTIAKRLAGHFNYAHLDTGVLYRAVTLLAINQKIDLSDQKNLIKIAADLTADSIHRLSETAALRSAAVGQGASKVAQVPGVRASLLQFQKDFCALPPDGKPGAVLDGRDIGTVIAPDAAVKIYVTASPEVRAHRRWKELVARGESIAEVQVLNELRERDARDGERNHAAASAAHHVIDTTNMTIEQAVNSALRTCCSSLNITF